MNLGSFDNIFDAACVALSAKTKLHGDFAHQGGY